MRINKYVALCSLGFLLAFGASAEAQTTAWEASSGLGTVNVVPKVGGTGSTAGQLIASALVDNGTIVSSSEPIDVQAGSVLYEVANAGTTGTTVGKLAKLTNNSGTANALIAATTDINGIAGVVFGSTGTATTGNAQIAAAGIVNCAFDAGTTDLDYVGISSSNTGVGSPVAGDCHDFGATPGSVVGQTIGRVLSTNGSAGTYAVLVTTGSTGSSSNVQIFQTTSGTFTPSAAFSTVEGAVCGPGGGGSSGAVNTLASGVVSGAGGGGGSCKPIGPMTTAAFLALGSSATLTLPVGGAGGVAVTSTGAPNAGAVASNATAVVGSTTFTGYAGGGGIGATSGAGGQGGDLWAAGAVGASTVNGNGGAGQFGCALPPAPATSPYAGSGGCGIVSSSSALGHGGSSTFGGPGGGSGGSINSSALVAGTIGGFSVGCPVPPVFTSGAAGGTASPIATNLSGCPGAGGSAALTGNAFAGGAGTNGGGGGGGGGAVNGLGNSGAGGAGGNSYAYFIQRV